jgi:hypothetical protein
MGVAYGPVQGISDARVDVAPNRIVIDACRIADSEPTRFLLRQSDPEATFLAVALTEQVMDFTIGRNPQWLRQSEFIKADVAIEAKRYQITTYLHVPAPSGALLRSGLVYPGKLQNEEETYRAPLEERVERSVSAAYALSENM